MNKNVMIGIIVIVVLAVIGVGTYFVLTKNSVETSTDGNQNQESYEEGTNTSNNKVLVVYYSATNNTKSVAEKISKNVNGDIFEIVPTQEYTSADLDWTNANSRVSKEHNDETLQNVALKTTKVDNWDDYDTILIGYPLWWGESAWPVTSFVKMQDFKDKTVIPFCTSASSGLGQSGTLLEEKANGGHWQEGIRFSSNASDTDIKKFTDKIK